MGARGAPVGNNNAGKNKPWAEALRNALATYEEGGIKAKQALKQIAKVTVQQALAGDKDARKEIAERLDGKPVQAIEGTGPDGALTIEIVKFACKDSS